MNTNSPEAIPHHPDADAFDFQKSIEMVKQAFFCHKLLIAASISLTLILVLIYIQAFPANYQAKVILIADSTEDTHRGDFYKQWNVFRSNSLKDEAEMMTSSIVISKVVDNLHLGYVDVYHTFMNHLGHLWVESWIGKNYRAVKYWLFPKRTEYSLTPEEIERGKTITSFKDGVMLQTVPDTNIGILIASGPSPRIADIVNTMIDIYLEERKLRMMTEAETAYNALKAEVDKASSKLFDIESKLEKHYEANNMLFDFEKDKLQLAGWLDLQATIVQSEATYADINAALAEIDRQLVQEKKYIVGSRESITNPARGILRGQIVQLQIELEQVKLRYHDNMPEVIEIEEQIKALSTLWEQEDGTKEARATQLISGTYQSLLNRRSMLKSEEEGLRAKLQVQKASERATSKKLKSLPFKSNITDDLERERMLLESGYVGLSNKLTIATVSKATITSAPPSIRVVDYAEYPEKPYWPKVKYLLLGAIIFGAIMGLLAAIMLDFIYGRVSRYHLSGTASYQSIYAIVPRDTELLARLYGFSNTKDKKAMIFVKRKLLANKIR